MIRKLKKPITKIGPFNDGLYNTDADIIFAISDFLAKDHITASAVMLTSQPCDIAIPDGTITAKILNLDKHDYWTIKELPQPLHIQQTHLKIESDGSTIIVLDYNPRHISDKDMNWLEKVAGLRPIKLDKDSENDRFIDTDEDIAQLLFSGIDLQSIDELWAEDYIAQTYCILLAGDKRAYTQSYLKIKANNLWKRNAKRSAPIAWAIALTRTRDFTINKLGQLLHLNRQGHVTDEQVYVSDGIAKTERFQGVDFQLTRRQATLIESHRRTSHSGYATMTADLKYVWWDRIHQHIKNLLKSCNLCDFMKTRVRAKATAKTHFRRGTFAEITIDSCGPYRVKKHDNTIEKLYIIVFLCEFSQFIWLELSSSNKAEDVARLLVYQVILDLVGGGIKIRTDRGSEYKNALITEVNRLLKNTAHFSNAYHPASLSRNEHSHKFILRFLRTEVVLSQNSIKAIQFAHRTTPKQQLDWKTPMEVVTARIPSLAFTQRIEKRKCDFGESNNAIIDGFIKTFHEIDEEVTLNRKEQARRRRDNDAHGAAFPRLKIGSLVLLDKAPVTTNPMRKTKTAAEDNTGFKIRKENKHYIVIRPHDSQIVIANLRTPEKLEKVNIKRLTPVVRADWTEYPYLPRGLLTVLGKKIPGQIISLGPGTLVKFEEDETDHIRTVDTRADDFEFHYSDEELAALECDNPTL